jgi:hypothetical protein
MKLGYSTRGPIPFINSKFHRFTHIVLIRGSEAILQLAVLGLMLLAYFTKMGARRNAVTHRLRRREGVGAPIFGLIGRPGVYLFQPPLISRASLAMGIGVFMQLQGPPNSLTVYP